MRNTLIWSFVAPILDVATGLLLALCLYAGVPFARFLRVAWFTPVLLSYVVVAIMWMWIYNYDWGVVNVALRARRARLARARPGWATRTSRWRALIVTHAWKWAGFNMVVCLAALHSLPCEVLEAAELDNCGWWQPSCVYIIVPMLRPTLLNLYILAFIGKMKIFDLVWIMTEGGPLWATETVSTYVYKRAFNWNTLRPRLSVRDRDGLVLVVVCAAVAPQPGCCARASGWSTDMAADRHAARACVLRGGALTLVHRPLHALHRAPFLWLATMSVRTTAEISADHYAWPSPSHWEQFRIAWVDSNFATYFWNSTVVVVAAVAVVTAARCRRRPRAGALPLSAATG